MSWQNGQGKATCRSQFAATLCGSLIVVVSVLSAMGVRAVGETWTTQTSAADNFWGSVTWGGPAGQELFVAVAYNGAGNRVMTSPDGITWTTQTSAADNRWSSVTWGGPAGQELLVAVAESGNNNRVMTSPDGITWTTQTSAADNNWKSVAWGGPAGAEKFVAVANTGIRNRVMTSSFVAAAPAAPTIDTISTGDGTLTVAFTAGADGGSAITNYKYSTDGTNYIALSPASTVSPFTITGLTNETSYPVTIKAVNSVGDSAASNAITATPATTTTTTTTTSTTVAPTTTTTSTTVASDTTTTAVSSPRPDTGTADTAKSTGQSIATQLSYAINGRTVKTSTQIGELARIDTEYQPSVIDSPFDIELGTSLTLNGTGFTPNTPLEVWIDSTPTRLATSTADRQGEFTITVQVPHELDTGDHTLRVEAVINAEPVTVRTGINLVTPTRNLPVTGPSDITNWSLFVATLGLLLVISRRRINPASRQ